MNTIHTNVSINTYQKVNTKSTPKQEKAPQKPTWNPNHVYRYLEDMNEGFQSYKKEAVSYYEALIAGEDGGGILTIEELKAQIAEYFPEYTLTDREPSDVKDGVNYLYIDEKNLQKLASDPDYRAKVYGLMDSELQGKKGYTLQYSDGRNVTAHMTGSIFSLAEKNRKYAGADGIPYLGSCKSDHCFSTSESHPQVRSMSFLYDNLDPAKSAAKDRKANAAKVTAERLAKKRKKKSEAKKKQERIEKKKERQERLEEKRQEKLQETIKQMKSSARYKSATDIPASRASSESDSTYYLSHTFGSLSEFTSYLASTYETFGNGMTTVSNSYLRACMGDENKRQELEKMLADADWMVQDAKENVKGYQGMKIHIDQNGSMETETYGGSVTFPEGKRMAQISSALSKEDIQSVMGLLAKDLAECENGVKNGLCDETEVQKVKTVMQAAEEKQRQLAGGKRTGAAGLSL